MPNVITYYILCQKAIETRLIEAAEAKYIRHRSYCDFKIDILWPIRFK